jgi:chromosome segregation ATPase
VLREKLKKEQNERERYENEANHQSRKVQLLESELDKVEDRLQTTVHRLELVEKARDDAELNLRSLENAEQTNFDRLDYQERALKDAQAIANESDRKYEEVSRKLVVVENELERAEKRVDDLVFENSKLKDEVRTYSNELKSFEAQDNQYNEREAQVRHILDNPGLDTY